MGTAWIASSTSVATEEQALRVVMSGLLAIVASVLLFVITRRRLHIAPAIFLSIVFFTGVISFVLLAEVINILVAYTGATS